MYACGLGLEYARFDHICLGYIPDHAVWFCCILTKSGLYPYNPEPLSCRHPLQPGGGSGLHTARASGLQHHQWQIHCQRWQHADSRYPGKCAHLSAYIVPDSILVNQSMYFTVRGGNVKPA